MRLKTIWTIPAMTLRERFSRTRDLALIKVAQHLPRALAYRSYIDTTVRYTFENPQAVVPDIRAMDVLQTFETSGVRV